MARRKSAPNLISFSSTISACEKGSQWLQALEIFKQMRARQLEVGENAFEDMPGRGFFIENLAFSSVFKRFQVDLWLQVDRICLNSLIASCVSHWAHALQLFQLLDEPNLISFNGPVASNGLFSMVFGSFPSQKAFDPSLSEACWQP